MLNFSLPFSLSVDAERRSRRPPRTGSVTSVAKSKEDFYIFIEIELDISHVAGRGGTVSSSNRDLD